MNNLEVIKSLLDRYLRIVHSPRNTSCRRMWKETRSIVLDKWRGCPRPGGTPVAVWLGTDILQPLMNPNMERYYREPLYFLETWLRVKIFHFENFIDDNYYDTSIPIWLGEGFEATLFGMPMRYAADKDPAIDRTFLPIQPGMNFRDLPHPDFRTSGLMPLALRFYEEISELVRPYGMDVGFINWGNGPQMTCNYLYGFENMSIGYLTDPEFVYNLLQWVTDIRIEWTRARAKFLGHTTIAPGEILDDDLSVPNVSPKVYDTFIFPAEKKLAEFHGGIAYWHDCGPADPFLETVHKLGRIHLMHSGPFSNRKIIAQLFGRTSAIEHHVKPMEEGTSADPAWLKRQLNAVKNIYRNNGVDTYTVRLTAYHHPRQNINQDVLKVKSWIELAKTVFDNPKV